MDVDGGNRTEPTLFEHARDKLLSSSLIQFVATVVYVAHRSKTKTTTRRHSSKGRKIIIEGCGLYLVNQEYKERCGNAIPRSFVSWCDQIREPAPKKWAQVADRSKPWFEAGNGSYIYFHASFQQWWMETEHGPAYWSNSSGRGMPPLHNKLWVAVSTHYEPLPQLQLFRH